MVKGGGCEGVRWWRGWCMDVDVWVVGGGCDGGCWWWKYWSMVVDGFELGWLTLNLYVLA